MAILIVKEVFIIDTKRKYRVIDCLKSIDIRDNSFVPSARTRIGGSHEGDLDLGHDCKTIYEYDNFSLLWVKQEPGVDSPFDNYVCHPSAEEIEFAVYGKCTMRYADGGGGPLVPGVCAYLPAGLPHGNSHQELDDVILLVFYPKPIAEVGRAEHMIDELYTGDKNHLMVDFFEAPANEIEEGHFVTTICNGDKISAAYHRLSPGCSVPDVNFTSHNVDEIVFVLEGNGIATYPDKTYELRPHLAFFNPAGCAHKFWNNTDKELKLLCLYVTGNVADITSEEKVLSVD